MRFNGEWLICQDGDTRPIIRAEILRADGKMLEFELLIDTGADRTVFSADVLEASLLLPNARHGQIGGVGGIVDTAMVKTQLQIRRDDGVPVAFRGEFAALTQPDVLEMSVLGRDILNRFALIIEHKVNVVTILGGHHYYTIQRSE